MAAGSDLSRAKAKLLLFDQCSLLFFLRCLFCFCFVFIRYSPQSASSSTFVKLPGPGRNRSFLFGPSLLLFKSDDRINYVCQTGQAEGQTDWQTGRQTDQLYSPDRVFRVLPDRRGVCVAYEVGEFERLSSPCCLIIIALLNQQSK